MMKRKALGRGLSALIPDADSTGGGRKGDFFLVNIQEIQPNRFQPRRDFDDAKIVELAASIKEKGIIQPLIVRELTDGYELIAGERRLRAAIRAGLNAVPVIIKDVSDAESLEIALIENIQREDLNPIEEAMAYQRLISEFEITQEEMARKVGKDRSTVTNSLRLLSLPDSVKEDLAKGILSPGHARALLSLADDRLILTVREKIISKALSVRDTESFVKKIKEKKEHPDLRGKQGVPEINIHVMELEDDLRRAMGTKVKILPSGTGGKIEITYFSHDDLDRIIEKICS